jgi:uncharacterized membrane protein
MPYCNACGNLVHDRDLFCGKCGVRQPIPVAPPHQMPPPPVVDPLEGVSPRTASILCYVPVVGWIAAVVVLASRRFRANQTVRFHAFQGLYLFAAWLVVDWGLRPILQAMGGAVFRFDRLLEALLLAASIFMLVKTSHEKVYSLPVIGDLAHRSLMEH